MKATNWLAWTLATALPALGGCGAGDAPPPAPAAKKEITNRIDLPPDVEQNLGVTWAVARQDRLETRLAVSGQLVVPEDRRRVVRAPVSGRLGLTARPWQVVAAGDVLGQIATAELKTLQEELFTATEKLDTARIDLDRAKATRAATEDRARALRAAAGATEAQVSVAAALRAKARDLAAAAADRAADLSKLEGTEALSRASLLAARRDAFDLEVAALEAEQRHTEAGVASKDRALAAAEAEARAQAAAAEIDVLARRVDAAEAARRQVLGTLASLTGHAVEGLVEGAPSDPLWARLSVVSLRAPSAGAIVRIAAADGTWCDRDAEVLEIQDAGELVFQGRVPEADAHRLRAGTPVRIEPAGGSVPPVETVLDGVRPVADPRTRTLLVEARVPNAGSTLPHGMSAAAHVLVAKSEQPEVLVPAACVVRDGLEAVVFRRDPADRAKVIRTAVTLGKEADGWVEAISGVGGGEELVRDGVHQLKQAGLGKAPAGGHFHADGTFHEGQ